MEIGFRNHFNTDGSLDTTFGGSGTGYALFYGASARTDGAVGASKYDTFYTLVEDSSGRIIAPGESRNTAGGSEILLARYLSDGTIDTSFGVAPTSGLGYVIYNTNGLGISGRANATKIERNWNPFIDSQGRYLVTGTTRNAAGGWESHISRYLSTGALDTSFASGAGFYLINPGAAGLAGAANATKIDACFASIVDSFGRTICAGQSLNGAGGTELFLLRVNSSGSLDI